jgi:hypothetical protein
MLCAFENADRRRARTDVRLHHSMLLQFEDTREALPSLIFFFSFVFSRHRFLLQAFARFVRLSPLGSALLQPGVTYLIRR